MRFAKSAQEVSSSAIWYDVGPEREVGAVEILPADEQVRSLFAKEKPLTVWDVATKLGNDYVETPSSVLDRFTEEGILGRFRVGFNTYYALPLVALTGKGPTLKAVISDTMKNLFLTLRDRMTRKPN